MTETVDWESCQKKCSDILDRFKSKYPSSEKSKRKGKDCPRNPSVMLKLC